MCHPLRFFADRRKVEHLFKCNPGHILEAHETELVFLPLIAPYDQHFRCFQLPLGTDHTQGLLDGWRFQRRNNVDTRSEGETVDVPCEGSPHWGKNNCGHTSLGNLARRAPALEVLESDKHGIGFLSLYLFDKRGDG